MSVNPSMVVGLSWWSEGLRHLLFMHEGAGSKTTNGKYQYDHYRIICSFSIPLSGKVQFGFFRFSRNTEFGNVQHKLIDMHLCLHSDKRHDDIYLFIFNLSLY